MNENKMGYKPTGPLLLGLAIPMMASMLVQALYNIVDSIYVAALSETALTAVSLAFPFQNLMIAVGVGTGVGVNACLSRALGAGQKSQAHAIAENGLFLALVSSLVFALAGLFFSSAFFSLQTADPELLFLGASYMRLVGLFCPGLFLSCMCEKLLASTGKTGLTMLTQMSGALINIVLDPLLIFVCGWGVAGAAIATVAGQIFGGILGLCLNLWFNREIQIRRPAFSLPVCRQIYSVGLPAILMQAVGSVMTFGLNQILIGFSTTAAAVFGIYFKLQSFIFMPVFGLNNGLVPLVAYNYGARSPSRILSAYKWGILYAFVVMALGTLAFWLFPGLLLSLFSASPQMCQLGIPALRTISISFVMASFCIITSALFQALGHGVLSMANAIIRQLVILLPCAWLLSLSGSVSAIWWCYPISEFVTVLCSLAGFAWVCRRQILPLSSAG